MEEQRETLGANIPAQEPVFAGVYTQDPLLFVHRQLTLQQVKLVTARYSPAYVRRKVRNWILAIAAATYFLITAYYGFLRNSQYASTVGDKIAIFRGYPGFGAPGYPVHLWTLGYGAERLTNRPAGPGELTWRAPLGQPVLPVVDAATRSDFLAARSAHEGKTIEARTMALEIISHPPQHSAEEVLNATLVFCVVATAEDVPYLHALLDSQRSEIRLAAAERLAALDPQYIYPIAERDLPSGEGFPHEDFIRHARGRCNPPLQHYLDSLLSINSNTPSTKQVIDTALRTGCGLSIASLMNGVVRPQMWGETDIARFATLQGEAGELGQSLVERLSSGHLDVVRQQSVIGTLASLPAPPCAKGFFAAIKNGPWWVRLEGAYAISRACSGYSLKMSWNTTLRELQFALENNRKEVWNLDLNPAQSDYRNAFQFLINVSETDRRSDVTDSLSQIAGQITDDYVRQRALHSLLLLGFTGPVDENLLDANNLEVRRAIFELIRRRGSVGLVPRLMARVGGADEFYVELLGRTPLTEQDLRTLHSRLSGSVPEQRQAACVLAMQDSADKTLALLTHPNAEIRDSAVSCVAYNAGARQILESLKKVKIDFPLESIENLESDLVLKNSLESELTQLKPHDREWRLRLLDDQPWGLLPKSLRYWVREQAFQMSIAAHK